MTRLLVALVRLYQLAWSSWRPATCRYLPGCSEYAVQALQRHGTWRGSWLATRRLLRCHPFHRGGHDPVPPARSARLGRPTGRPAPTSPAATPWS